MTAEDLVEIEGQIERQLPAAYRDLMLTYPFARGSWAAECAMPNDIEHLQQLNPCAEFLGSIGVPDPESFYCIGSDGGEETYYIRLAGPDFTVHVADVETGDFQVKAHSVAEWVALLRAADAEIESDERHLAERPWWKVWT